MGSMNTYINHVPFVRRKDMKANWKNTRIIVSGGITKEEFVCNECKLDIFSPCYKTSVLGDEPKDCINQDKKHFNKPISLLREETQQG